MAERGRARYRRYSGGDPLAPPVDLGEALSAIGEDVMAGYSPEAALREFLRRGGRSQAGLDDLANRIARKRRELLQRHHLDGTLQEVRRLLDEAVLAERGQIARDTALDSDDAAFREMQLANLPPNVGQAVSELGGYDWRSGEARRKFEQIKDLLGRELLEQRFKGMKAALEGATDADRQAVNAMLSDLNALLEKRRLGEDTPEDFAEFMRKHGDHFPEDPQDLDELMDALAARAAAARRMLNSMTPEQRRELMALSAAAFGSPALADLLDRLDDNLQSLRPGEDWYGSEEFGGDEGMGLGEGAGVLQELSELDALSEQLSQGYRGSSLDDIDLDALARHLGDGAAVEAKRLQEIERALKASGQVERASDGSLRMTPRAMRTLGKSLLKDIAQRLSGRGGNRDTRSAGRMGDLTGATKPWEFGSTEPWDLPASLRNALTRSGTMRLAIDDVEVLETEDRTSAAVALLVDTSFSMAMDGRWVPMKRTALALHTLVKSRFRGDALQLIGFGRHAETMEIEQLTGMEAKWDKGTNLHHALLLAERFFRRHPNAQPVLLIVTDGEPTSHLEASGEVYFSYPPHPLTLAYTVRELDNVRRLGVQTTFFRLGEDPGLARFVDQMARRIDGKVVAPELDDLGAEVVRSYMSDRG